MAFVHYFVTFVHALSNGLECCDESSPSVCEQSFVCTGLLMLNNYNCCWRDCTKPLKLCYVMNLIRRRS